MKSLIMWLVEEKAENIFTLTHRYDYLGILGTILYVLCPN
jgi:hypothetical protein